jgi:hypothetical protein
MTKYTLQIYRLVGAKAFSHHRQVFEFEQQNQAAALLIATREGLPPGYAASMTYQSPKTKTHTNVRLP